MDKVKDWVKDNLILLIVIVILVFILMVSFFISSRGNDIEKSARADNAQVEEFREEQVKITQEIEDRMGIGDIQIPSKEEFRKAIVAEFGEDVDFYADEVFDWVDLNYEPGIASIYKNSLLPDPELTIEEQELLSMLQFNTYYSATPNSEKKHKYYINNNAIKSLSSGVESTVTYKYPIGFAYYGEDTYVPHYHIPVSVEDKGNLYLNPSYIVTEADYYLIRGANAVYSNKNNAWILQIYISPKEEQTYEEFLKKINEVKVTINEQEMQFNMNSTLMEVSLFEEHEILDKMIVNEHTVIPLEFMTNPETTQATGEEPYIEITIDKIEMDILKSDDPYARTQIAG